MSSTNSCAVFLLFLVVGSRDHDGPLTGTRVISEFTAIPPLRLTAKRHANNTFHASDATRTSLASMKIKERSFEVLVNKEKIRVTRGKAPMPSVRFELTRSYEHQDLNLTP